MWTSILAGALGCYALKLSGVMVPLHVLESPRVQRVALLLPVALLAALIATQAFTEGESLTLDARAAGVAMAVVAVALRAPFLVTVAAACATTALLRLAA
jgi:uncharacterized membrane protein